MFNRERIERIERLEKRLGKLEERMEAVDGKGITTVSIGGYIVPDADGDADVLRFIGPMNHEVQPLQQVIRALIREVGLVSSAGESPKLFVKKKTARKAKKR